MTPSKWSRALETVTGTADLFPRRVLYSSHARHEKAEGTESWENRGTKKSACLSGRGPPVWVFLAPAPNLISSQGVVKKISVADPIRKTPRLVDPFYKDFRMPNENRSRKRQDCERHQVFKNPACPGQAEREAFSERPEERDAPDRQTVFRDMEKGSGRQPQKERSQWGTGLQKERCPHSNRRRKPPVGDGSVRNPERNVQVRKNRTGEGSREPRKAGSGKKCDAGGDDPVV